MHETDRLIFRKYTLDDLDLLLDMTSDPDVMKYIGDGKTWSIERTLESLQRFIEWNEADLGLYVAMNKYDKKMIGHAGLIPQTVDGQSEIEVGYWVVKDQWGQGYGFEQASAWKNHGLDYLNRTRLVSIIQHGNIGSKKVAEKNGMSHEKDIEFNGKDVALYSLNKHNEEN